MKKIFISISWRRLLYYLGITLGAALFLPQLVYGAQAIRQQELQLSQLGYLLAAAGATFIAYTLQMMAWSQIMGSLGVFLDLSIVWRGYAVSFLPRYIPGTVWGYLSRSEWFKTHCQVPYAKSISGSILEIGLILVSASVIIVVYCLGRYGSNPLLFIMIPIILALPWLLWYGLNLITVLFRSKQRQDSDDFISGVDLRNKSKNCPKGLRAWEMFPSLSPPFLYGLLHRLSKVDLRYWLRAYIIYLMMWGCHSISLILLLNIFRIEHNYDIFKATFIFCLAWFIGFVVLITPSGLGIRELALSTLLIFQYGVPTNTASAVSIVARFVVYLAEIIWLIIALKISNSPQSQNLRD